MGDFIPTLDDSDSENSDNSDSSDKYSSSSKNISAAKRAQQLEDKIFHTFDKLQKDWCIIRCTVRIVKWLPPFFIFLVFCFAYYVMSYLFCYLQLYQIGQYYLIGSFCFFFFNIIFFITIISFYRAIYSNPGIVPDEFYDRVRSVIYSPLAEQYKTCTKCNKPKPPRSHHCRHCNACIRKMDHHCPVINNCVGWGNYKYFVLLLTWSCIMCWYGLFCGILKFILIGLTSSYIIELQIIIGLFISFAYSITLAVFAAMHYSMIFKNRGTLDNILFKHHKNVYNLGRKENFSQVFGDDPLYWFLPVFTAKGDGCSFPTTITHEHTIDDKEDIIDV